MTSGLLCALRKLFALMTNRHVAKLFSTGLGTHIVFHVGDSVVNFARQVDSQDPGKPPSLKVTSVEMVHPYWDMALLNVDGLAPDKILELSVTSPEDLIGRNIIVLGYPAKDWRNDEAVQERFSAKSIT